jgi:hypothetical protein
MLLTGFSSATSVEQFLRPSALLVLRPQAMQDEGEVTFGPALQRIVLACRGGASPGDHGRHHVKSNLPASAPPLCWEPWPPRGPRWRWR